MQRGQQNHSTEPTSNLPKNKLENTTYTSENYQTIPSTMMQTTTLQTDMYKSQTVESEPRERIRNFRKRENKNKNDFYRTEGR